MFVIDVVPLTHLPKNQPQVLSYFYAEPILKGSLVKVKINNRLCLAVVLDSVSVAERKAHLKSADFQLKKVSEILISPFFDERHLSFALWLADYYYEDLSLVFRFLVPSTIEKWLKNNGQVKVAAARINQKKPVFKKEVLDPKAEKKTLIDLIAHYFLKKKRVLILTPTILHLEHYEALMKNQFKFSIVSSELSPKNYLKRYLEVLANQAPIILATRSGALLPFRQLDAIIVLDEYNPAYKSWDQRPYYQTVRLAQKLSSSYGADLYLFSSYPQLGDNTLKLKTSFNLSLIDLAPETEIFGRPIVSLAAQKEIKDVLKQSGRIILFLNRLGTATSIICPDCGYVFKCPHCDLPLVYHRHLEPLLLCHHCNYQLKAPDVCPHCGGHRLKLLGLGTERVLSELERILKDEKATILRLDSETAKNYESQKEIISQFNQKKKVILIGTELIFRPQLKKADLAVALYPDPLLMLPDFRSEERVFGYLWQLANSSRKLLIQTYLVQNKMLQDFTQKRFNDFFLKEAYWRQKRNWPPYCQLIKITGSHKESDYLYNQLLLIKRKMERFILSHHLLAHEIEILGPAPAFVAKTKNYYFWHLIIKSRMHDEKLEVRNQLLDLVPSGYRIDIEPKDIL